MQKKLDIQFVICPKCNGIGKNKLELRCPNCYGMGLGVFLNGVFFYWGLKLGKAVINLRNLKKNINLFINLFFYIVGLLGLISLGFWIWQSEKDLEYFLFWRFKNIFILVFWIGILADMFIFYRLSYEKYKKYKIKKRDIFNKKNKDSILPNNWEELRKSKFKIDVSKGYSENAMKAVEDSFILANELSGDRVLALHLFYSLLKDDNISSFFIRLNTDGKKLVEKIRKQLLKNTVFEKNKIKAELSNDIKEILIEAYVNACDLGQKKVEVLNLLLPCVQKDENLEEILYDLEVDQDKINNVAEWFRINSKLVEDYKIYKKMARFKPGKGMNRAYTAVATPVLNHFSQDLTLAAKWGRLDICVSRTKEIESIFSELESGHIGIILTGFLGVGKRTIVNGIASLMVKEEVPKILKDKRLVELDLSRLLSGASPEQAQERLLVVIDEVARAGNIILYIDNIENLIGITAGNEESLELSEVLVSAIDQKRLCCIASVTNENYNKYIEGKPLGEAMYKININEPQGNQAIQIVESKVGIFEAKYKVYFSYNAISEAINLSDKYIHDKYLPLKAIQILESTAVRVSKKGHDDSSKNFCTKENIAETVHEITNIPTQKITESESKSLLNLEDRIHKRMINQEEAVRMVADSLRRARTQLREGKRPIANFLFLGPTGVGKTELAKSVAAIHFGDEKYMIRIDMSEYQHSDSVKKMIGDSSILKGYLTEAVRKQSFALILLDEIDKAHPDILNLFLQVMDDGRLTDGGGKTIDFTNSIIIATSNAGAVFIQDQIKANVNIEKIKEDLINDHLNKVMRPEFINRFDGIVVFKPLSMKNVVDIAGLMLNKTKKMLEKKGISMRSEQEGIKKLAEQGFDPKFGARPLRRILQDKIENEIAKKVLSGELIRRDTVVINDKAEIIIEKGREL